MERQIEGALRPGEFIYDRECFSFVSGLEQVANGVKERLRRFEEARKIFDRMLWLNPSDNQGVRFPVDDVRAKVAWEDSQNR